MLIAGCYHLFIVCCKQGFMRKLVIVLLLTVFRQLAVAQFSDSTHYYFNYSSTGSINHTNDGSSYLLNNGFKFGIKKKRIALNLNNAWIYGSQDNNLTNNDYAAGLDFDLYRKNNPHFYYWGLANYTTSYSLKIKNQLQSGLGAAYSLFDRSDAYLNISDGILFESSNLYLNDTTHDVYQTFRNSLRVQFKFIISKRIEISGSHFWQPSLSRGNDYILRSNINLGIKLQKWLSITTAFNYNKFSRTHRENLLFTYGLTFEKYF